MIGDEWHLEEEKHRAGLPDVAPLDDASQQRLRGAEAELGAEHVHDAGGLRGVEHALRVGAVSGERLLADHVLARLD